MIIYPAIDIMNGRCVRLVQGDFGRETVYADDPAGVAKKWQEAGAEYIHVVDLEGSRAGSAKNDSAIEKILAAVSIPVQTGGGIRNMADVERKLGLGVSRVILGTAAVKDKDFVREAIARYGRAIVIGIDALNKRAATQGWEDISGVGHVELALEMKSFGAATVIYTNIAKDGMMSGPDFEATEEMIKMTGMEIIASGGVRSIEDLPGLKSIGAAGVIIGKALYENAIDLKEAIRKAK